MNLGLCNESTHSTEGECECTSQDVSMGSMPYHEWREGDKANGSFGFCQLGGNAFKVVCGVHVSTSPTDRAQVDGL